jgi:muconolactone delta-isomerase
VLYEVITKANPMGITGEEFLRRLPEGVTYMKDLRARGVIIHSWIRVGGYGATTIFSVTSHEELAGYLNGNPLVPHVSFEIIPLAESESFSGNLA